MESRREGFYIYYTINRGRMVEFREQFELLHATVMANCNREMVRRTNRDRAISACVIFYSYSGITRRVAEGIRNASGCDLIEVKTRNPYTSFSAYTTGVLRSRKMECDPIEPAEIDVSGYDFLIIGTPVWAWKPTPAINGAVRALRGCEGKMAVIFTTCSTQPGEALPILSGHWQTGVSGLWPRSPLMPRTRRTRKRGASLLRRIIGSDPLRALDQGTTGEQQDEREVKL